MELRGQSKTLADGVGRADDVDVAFTLEHGRDAFTDDRMILDDEDFDHVGLAIMPGPAEPSR